MVLSSDRRSQPILVLIEFQAIMPWVMITPLGRLVVPDVYMIRVGSSGPISTSGGGPDGVDASSFGRDSPSESLSSKQT